VQVLFHNGRGGAEPNFPVWHNFRNGSAARNRNDDEGSATCRLVGTYSRLRASPVVNVLGFGARSGSSAVGPAEVRQRLLTARKALIPSVGSAIF
jgi:hypothetical protein